MKVNFLIADEIRSETSGKHTVLGLYPDHTIVIEKTQDLDTDVSTSSETIDRLAILVNISDANAGEHEIQGQIFDPSGNPHGNKINFGKMSIEKNASRSFVIVAKSFLIKGRGTYYFNLYVDGDTYNFPFKIIDRASK